MLPHAPGVQMQAIPEDAVPDDTVDEDTEDPDKRLSSKTAVHFHTISPLTCSKNEFIHQRLFPVISTLLQCVCDKYCLLLTVDFIMF